MTHIVQDDTKCGQCGRPITDESPTGDPRDRKPCPDCGSTTRILPLRATSTGRAFATADAYVVTYPEALLRVAKTLIGDGQCAIAVVVAHMACEVATERSFSAAFAAKGLQYLEGPVLDLINGYNLANDRNRRLYTAVTGDSIEQQAFWASFKESATRRNKVVHEGKIANTVEAEASHAAASAFVRHLKQ